MRSGAIYRNDCAVVLRLCTTVKTDDDEEVNAFIQFRFTVMFVTTRTSINSEGWDGTGRDGTGRGSGGTTVNAMHIAINQCCILFIIVMHLYIRAVFIHSLSTHETLIYCNAYVSTHMYLFLSILQ
jgi:hypothetical protein